jgi:hypothetical protein
VHHAGHSRARRAGARDAPQARSYEQRQARRREFEGQWKAVEKPAELRDRCVVSADFDPVITRARREELARVLVRKRFDAALDLAAQP